VECWGGGHGGFGVVEEVYVNLAQSFINEFSIDIENVLQAFFLFLFLHCRCQGSARYWIFLQALMY
jgi:hypothetical protein